MDEKWLADCAVSRRLWMNVLSHAFPYASFEISKNVACWSFLETWSLHWNSRHTGLMAQPVASGPVMGLSFLLRAEWNHILLGPISWAQELKATCACGWPKHVHALVQWPSTPTAHNCHPAKPTGLDTNSQESGNRDRSNNSINHDTSSLPFTVYKALSHMLMG